MIKNESQDELLKLTAEKSKLIEEQNDSTKKLLREIISLSQNTLYDIRMYLSGRKKEMIEIKEKIKCINY